MLEYIGKKKLVMLKRETKRERKKKRRTCFRWIMRGILIYFISNSFLALVCPVTIGVYAIFTKREKLFNTYEMRV